jgi:phosphoesterase RecJ-like protein
VSAEVTIAETARSKTVTDIPPVDPGLLLVLDLIEKGNRFVVTGHMSPDGDVLGSMSALALVLRRLGKEAVVFNRDPAPDKYAFLPLMDELVNELPEGPFDAAFIVDCCEPARVSPDFGEAMGDAKLVAIDHHATPFDKVDFGFHDEKAAATGVLIYRLARTLGVHIDAELGQGIFVALVTDTGNFRYSNAGPESFSIASDLVNVGVNPHAISRHLYENEPMAKLKLLGEALSRLELSHDGRIGWMLMPDGALDHLGATPEMLDGAVDYGRQVAGVEVSCLIRRNDSDPTEFRLSLRSKGLVDVEAVAAKLGGGGHRMASGSRFKASSLEDAAAQVRAHIEAALPD